MSGSEDSERVRVAVAQLLAEHPPASTNDEQFLGYQFDVGLAWVHFPVGEGGLGLSPALQDEARDRLLNAGAPSAFDRNTVGLGMAAPTIARHGTREQRGRYLRRLFTGEDHWCQLFSEPGAGSDLASVSTRAIRDGDDWIVTGQKVWTTRAHLADRGILIARTDPDAPKHRGLTYFLVDMHLPGIEVRPLRQITGEREFNEVFLSEVRVPDIDRLGAVGDGWRVALTTLMNERMFVSSSRQARGSGPISVALDLWVGAGAPSDNLVLRDRLVQRWIEAELVRLTSIRAMNNGLRGEPGPEASIIKLASTESYQRIYELCMELLGTDALLFDSYELEEPSPSPQRGYLRSKANSIEGGTSEVLRNILAERVLGLPAEPRVDKDRPWSQVPRS